jgi:hypothetical protein
MSASRESEAPSAELSQLPVLDARSRIEDALVADYVGAAWLDAGTWRYAGVEALRAARDQGLALLGAMAGDMVRHASVVSGEQVLLAVRGENLRGTGDPAALGSGASWLVVLAHRIDAGTRGVWVCQYGERYDSPGDGTCPLHGCPLSEG